MGKIKKLAVQFANDWLLPTQSSRPKMKRFPEPKPAPNWLAGRKLNGGEFGFYDAGGSTCVVGASQLGDRYESFVNFSYALANGGVSFVGLDYNGLRTNGKNGVIEIDRTIDDFHRALEFAKGGHDKVVAVGSCFGGDVAYLSSMETAGKLNGLIIYSPKMPSLDFLLWKYLRRAWVIKNPVFSRVASFLRETDMISLAEALGEKPFFGDLSGVLFEQKDVRSYLNRQPLRVRKDIPITVVGGEFDRVVPVEHTRRVAEKLKEMHGSVDYKEVGADHHLLRKNPELVVNLVTKLTCAGS
ncbi:MAG: alpha/beta hydrolase [Nanoarchaeota archaeon]|nr:alpha/beta hydrolase [Nanoarchaeota archaeon]MBU1103561.1 alpha/beta hydrolase [Nanoarchaeota archaeon]